MTRKTTISMLAGAMAVMVWMTAGVAAQSATTLGTVRLAQGVTADGKALPAGSYSLRVSADPVTSVVGQGADHAKWVEFVQGGEVKGRELASVVPAAEIQQVVDGKAPASGAAKVEMLKGGEYLRVWAHRGGSHYLIHLVIS
jgi:hypothetical protein